MRLRILALFVALQLSAFPVWYWVTGTPPTVATPSITEPLSAHRAAAPKVSGAVHFSSRNAGDTVAVVTRQGRLEQLVTQTLAQLPAAHAQSVRDVILDYDPVASRGLGGQQMVILKAGMDSREFVGVLVHEVGHNVDLVALSAADTEKPSVFKDGDEPVYTGDPSLDFYRISWQTEITRKKTADNLDFVSGYAMTDPFEDFAETYAYFVLHGRDFKAKVAGSAALFAKWRFMKYRVFAGVEFDTGNALADPLVRPWDVTVLPYDAEKFLND